MYVDWFGGERRDSIHNGDGTKGKVELKGLTQDWCAESQKAGQMKLQVKTS